MQITPQHISEFVKVIGLVAAGLWTAWTFPQFDSIGPR